MKKYDSFKECIITTSTDEIVHMFTNDWTFKDIESWMLDKFCIDKQSILSIRISSVTIYKTTKQ